MIKSAPISESNLSTNQIPHIAQSVDELLSYYDEKFVHCAYQTLLGRLPDVSGLNYYVARLRKGVSKEEILLQIVSGSEGKKRRQNLDGLDTIIRRTKILKFLFSKFCFFAIQLVGKLKKR